MRQWIGSLALCLLVAGAFVLPAFADTMNWIITNKSSYQAQVSFYAQGRRSEWPGHGRAWDLFDHSPHKFSLNCLRGEKICYGAFVYKTHARSWGVGFNNSKSCRDCCAICAETTTERALGN